MIARDSADRLRHRADRLAGALPPLLVAAERVAATVAQGVHGRRRVGAGESFWQFRRYQAGDPLRAIDWRQTAKSQRVFVREQEWEASQTVYLWRDASASMGWRSDPTLPSKRERADVLLLALASLLGRAGERVGLLGGSAPPTVGRANLERMALALAGTGKAGETDKAADDPLPPVRVPAYAELVLIGDFLGPLDELDRWIADHAGSGQRGHLLQILDPAETDLPYHGRIRFAGLEAGEEELLIPRVGSIRAQYVDRLTAQQRGLQALAGAAGWTVGLHRTDRPAQSALLHLFASLGQSGGPARAGAGGRR